VGAACCSRCRPEPEEEKEEEALMGTAAATCGLAAISSDITVAREAAWMIGTEVAVTTSDVFLVSDAAAEHFWPRRRVAATEGGTGIFGRKGK